MEVSGLNSEQRNKIGAQIFLILFCVFLLYALRDFINIFLGSIIIYVLFKPVMLVLTERFRWNKSLSAIVIILLSFAIVLVPSFYVIKLFFGRISSSLNPENLNETLNLLNLKGKEILGIELVNPENIRRVQLELTAAFTDIVSQSIAILGDIGIMYFILFYLLLNTGNIERLLEKYIPVDSSNLEILGKELEQQTYSNALGAPVLATLQGIIASIGFYFFDVSDFLFWGIMAGIFSIIPVVGSALIWLPASLILLSKGMQWQGIGLMVYGVAIISTIDNAFRFIFQKKIADVHPLITIIGVIFGLQMFGIAGSIYGPLLLSYFLILLKMYRERFGKKSS
jgi:predicted PurR-regulated permease PerM